MARVRRGDLGVSHHLTRALPRTAYREKKVKMALNGDTEIMVPGGGWGRTGHRYRRGLAAEWSARL